jgi:hypothetical protein
VAIILAFLFFSSRDFCCMNTSFENLQIGDVVAISSHRIGSEESPFIKKAKSE